VIRTHTRVDALEPLADGGFAARLSTGETVRAARVINATGAWSIELNRALGIDLPNHPHRHEILSSEPLKPFLDPLVVDLETGLYFSQSTRGEIVTGITLPDPPGHPTPDTIECGSSLRFLSNLARALIRVLPIARHLHPLRQWSGPYDISPDGDAIVGPSPGHPQLIQVCGFTGHGFMMAPAVGRLLARWLLDGQPHPMLERWDPSRFADGRQLRREDMIIG
jgi:sarcosine oxidase, subunit beta